METRAMAFRVSEPTLGPEVAKLLESFLGCPVAQQGVLPGRKQFDFLLQIDNHQIVVELEIGAWQKLPEAIVQAQGYKEQMAADGIIAVVYPEAARREVSRPEDVRDLALSLPVSSIVLTPFLKDFYSQISLSELAQKLKESLALPSPSPSVTLVVETLRQSVRGIALEIKRSLGMDNPLMQETVGSLPLFLTLSQEGEAPALKWQEEERLKGVVADLAGYILVNQLLLYRILSSKLGWDREGKAMKPVGAPLELKPYFQRVTDINYRPVFCVDTAATIPHSATSEVNISIGAIGAVQPENLSHDLLGRIFHEFLPHETRKQLGAFYTRPQAAEMLAALAIERATDKVLDPACGSGTLLVAAYRRKKTVWRLRPHWKLVGEELTGVDIMPFAAHLTALNLTLQSPLEETNRTRIGIGNSLNLLPGKEVGTTAQWLRTFGKEVVPTEEGEQKGEVFRVAPVDVVMMNPPFTRKERLTPEMKSPQLYAHLGEQNYWAYFMAMADKCVKAKGKIAAVLPRDFFRGKYSRVLREYLFKDRRWGIRYIVKSTKDTAFSEQAAFRDFLVVLERGYKGKLALAYLNKPLNSLSLIEAGHIGELVHLAEEGQPYPDEAVAVVWRSQEEVWGNCSDLGHLVVFNTEAGEVLLASEQNLLPGRQVSLCALKDLIPTGKEILRGITPWEPNLIQMIFLVRPLHPNRVERSSIVLAGEKEGKLIGKVKMTAAELEIPLGVTVKGLKTPSYVDRLDVTSVADIAVIKPFGGIELLQKWARVSHSVDFGKLLRIADKRMCHLSVVRRFNFTAPGLKALAFFSEKPLLPSEAFWAVPLPPAESRILCCWLNSALIWIQILLGQRETEGSFIDITSDKLSELKVPKLSAPNLEVLTKAFEMVKDEPLPSLSEQFGNPPPARLIIDRAVLNFLGYSDKEIDDLLPEVYEALDREMRSFKELMKGTPRRAPKAEAAQLHLL